MYYLALVELVFPIMTSFITSHSLVMRKHNNSFKPWTLCIVDIVYISCHE